MNRPLPRLLLRACDVRPGRFVIAATAAVLSLLGMSGCQSTPAPFDPFLSGRSTIAPPATAVPAGQAPYYNAQPPTVSIPGGQTTIYTPPGAVPAAVPVTPVPSDGSGRFPRGISLPQSNSSAVEKETQLAEAMPSDEGAVTATADADRGTPTPLKFKNSLADATKGRDVVPVSHSEPAMDSAIRGAASPVDRASPAAGKWAAPGEADGEASNAAGNRNAERSRGRLPELTDFPPASSASLGGKNYGFDAGYAWLEGRLEYSPRHKRWKLRYIAIEGPTDDFGGSVVLPDAEKLAGFEPGDFVRIQGRVLEPPSDAKRFSPTYSIERISKQQTSLGAFASPSGEEGGMRLR